MEVRKRRIAKKKRRVVLRLLLFIFIILLVAVGIVLTIFLLSRNDSNIAHFSELPFKTTVTHFYSGNGFLYLQGDSVYYDDANNDKFDYYVPMFGDNPQLAASKTIHLLYNDAGIKIVNESFPINISGTLQSVKCGENYLAALVRDLNDVESIQVYSSDGAMQDQHVANEEFIIDYGFYTAKSEYLYIITMASKSGTPVSTITIYDVVEKNTRGVMTIQNQLIEKLYFSSGSIFADCTNQIIRFSDSNRETYHEMIYGWKVKDFSAAGGSPCFLLYPRGADHLGTINLLQVKDGDLSEAQQRMLQLPAGTIDVYLMGAKLVALSQTGYTIFEQNGSISAEKSFAVAIDAVQKLNSTTLLVSADTACYTLKIS
jgi:hypothetical protein